MMFQACRTASQNGIMAGRISISCWGPSTRNYMQQATYIRGLYDTQYSRFSSPIVGPDRTLCIDLAILYGLTTSQFPAVHGSSIYI